VPNLLLPLDFETVFIYWFKGVFADMALCGRRLGGAGDDNDFPGTHVHGIWEAWVTAFLVCITRETAFAFNARIQRR
jgi:hypothetical protein